MADEATAKRIAIVGTAPSWKTVPFHDKGLTIACLNDAYMLNVPRADLWFDLHDFGKFWYRPKTQKVVNAFDVPIGSYVRPEGHIEWLAQQTIPVYVQQPVAPNMTRFPKEEIEARFKPYFPTPIGPEDAPQVYFQSTPAWMVAWAFVQGYTQCDIYGIHLATQWEYVEQRPNFECVLGIVGALGMKVRIAPASPVCRPSHVYAYTPKPNLDVERVQRQAMQAKAQRDKMQATLNKKRWWEPKGGLKQQIALVSAHLVDKDLQIQRLMLAKRAL